MAWASYKNSTRYYLKVREGKKVHSIYMGNGEEAHAAAKGIEESAKERERLREIRMSDKALDERINALISKGNTLTASTLKAAGFYQYQRQWKIKAPRTKQ
ncbi:MAG: hypothetical protein K8R38_01315 [Verrucomicrobia bacterium]|jgi:acetylornithine deacetylase/succinyl-diaminopimelate desuccinylase-like protein|nr:hypothetical protein [Verrucomicrobiota bacterium]